MSEPRQVRISRGGQEIGTYAIQEALRQLFLGHLKPTDFYWEEGMAEWAPLSQLKASEERRQEAERLLREKQEQAKNAEQVAREKVKVKEEEERAVAEATRIRMEQEKANWFRCHCCRESFKKPTDPSDNFIPSILGLLISGVITFIPIVGWVGGPIMGIYCVCNILSSQLVSPHCPTCRSTNFSRPEKPDEQK